MLRLVTETVLQPTAAVPTGGYVLRIADNIGALSIAIPGSPFAATQAMTAIVDGSYLFSGAGFAVGTYTATVTDAGGPLTLTATFQIVGLPTLDAVPPALAAAHLPVLLVARAAPLGFLPAPAALLLVVEVLRGAAWQEVGRLRETCDPVTGTCAFDLSEYLKTQFTDTAPDESGDPDPALAIPYRARYGRLPTFTGPLGTEAGTVAGLAVNAAEVVNPGGDPLPLVLGPASPYASVPTGFAGLLSTVNAAATGIGNVPTVPALAAPCPVRQFVWLTRRGAWSWGLFTGRHEHGTDTAEDAIVRRAGGDYYVGGGDVRRTLRVYSDKVDFATFLVLREVRRSRRVYERLVSGLYVPVLVEKGSAVDYKETDKVFEVNFTVKYPVLPVQTF